MIGLLIAAILSAPVSSSPGTVPCVSEDAPGRCVWDARHRGNGYGASFIRHRDGSLTYVTHRRAHRISSTTTRTGV